MIPMYLPIKTANCGDVVPYYYENAYKVHVMFMDTGHIRTTSASILRKSPVNLKDPMRPVVYGVGYLGVGRHKSHAAGGATHPCIIWRGILLRCYGKSQASCYRGVTVAKVWHNFQNFADWYEANGGRRGLQEDKDILAEGNKEYHPDKCLIVTPQENMEAANPNCDLGALLDRVRRRARSASS